MVEDQSRASVSSEKVHAGIWGKGPCPGTTGFALPASEAVVCAAFSRETAAERLLHLAVVFFCLLDVNDASEPGHLWLFCLCWQIKEENLALNLSIKSHYSK